MTAATSALDRWFLIERRLYGLEKAICVSSLFIMLLAVAGSVIVRNFNLPIVNPGEYGIVAMSPLTFVGAAMCSYTGTHIAVDIIALVKSPAIRRLARLVVALAMICFATVYLWAGWHYMIDAADSGERLLDTGTPVVIALMFLPLGMAMVLVHTVSEVLRVATGRPAQTEEIA